MKLAAVDAQRVEQAGELLEMAALDHRGLGAVFPEVSRLLNASMFQLFYFTDPAAPDLIVSASCAGLVEDYLLRGWHELDIYTHSAAQVSRHGIFIGDHRLLDKEVRARDPFYHDFGRKWDIGGYSSRTFNLAGERWSFTLMSHYGAPLDDWGLAMMRQLAPAADRAALLAAIAKDARVRGIAEGLEHGNRPTFVLDHRGQVVLFTPAARRLLGDDLFIRGGRLQARDVDGDAALRQTAAAAGLNRPPPLSNFTVQRHGRRPLFVMPVAVRDMGLDRLPGARIILIISDVESQMATDRAVLAQAFGLTSREAELAQLIGGGREIQSSAEAMQVSESTARHMLKTIFSKTGVHRQAELVALVAQLSSDARPVE